MNRSNLGCEAGAQVLFEQLEPRLLLSAALIERVSVASDGTQANGYAMGLSVSSDGRFVAFQSGGSNLVPGDTNSTTDIFVYDRTADTIERVNLANGGTQANNGAANASISGDGRFVAFNSGASNLVPGDTNGSYDVFVYDRTADTVERVSVASNGTQANDYCWGSLISSDGRFVTFYTDASNLVPGDTNNKSDVFVYDRTTDTVERVSVASNGTQANGYSASPSISSDGRFVAFNSDASNLVPGDTNSKRDIFVYDRTTDTVERVSIASAGTQANDGSQSPSISADGRFVAFNSDASNLVPGDTNGMTDIFVYDRTAHTTERVSVASNGTQANGYSYSPSISADGRFVAFDSDASNLVPHDTNSKRDIFVHDRTTDAVQRLNVASNGTQGNATSSIASISANGQFVAFGSDASNLVPGDTNAVTDVFVAAVGGNGTNTTVSINDVTVTEPVSGTANAVFTVQLSSAATSPVKVNYATSAPIGVVGAATAGTDFKTTAGTLTIGAGKTSGTITVQIMADAVTEGAETFFVNLTNPVGATISDAQAQGTIHDPPKVGVSVDVGSIKEVLGAPGQVATFTVTSDTAAPAGGLPVTLTFTGAAKAKTQYTLTGVASNNTVTIPAGQTSVTFTAAAIDDKKVTGDVNAIVTVKSGSKVYNLGVTSLATVTIIDGDPKVSISTNVSSIHEVLGGAGQTATFTVTSDTVAPAGGLPVTLAFTGTAKSAQYTLSGVTGGKVTIPAGQTTATFTATAKDDKKATGDVTLIPTVKAGKLYGQGVTPSATVTIVDADPKISVSASSTQLTEAAGPNHSVIFTISSTKPAPAGGLKVYGTLSGTAKWGSEYDANGPTLGNGFVTIPAGATTTTITATARNDNANKGNKTIILSVSTNAAYSIDPTHKSVTVNLIDM